MSGKRDSASRIGHVAAVVRRHFADPTFYARRYRDGAPPSSTSAEHGQLNSLAWARWLPRWPSGVDGRPKAPPSALDRWLVRPAVFLPATLIGAGVVAAMADVPRDAPFFQQSLVLVGIIAAWFGLVGAASYVGGRWPRAEPILIVALILLGIATFVTGIILTNRVVVGSLLIQSGIWMTIVPIAAWWKKRSGRRKK